MPWSVLDQALKVQVAQVSVTGPSWPSCLFFKEKRFHNFLFSPHRHVVGSHFIGSSYEYNSIFYNISYVCWSFFYGKCSKNSNSTEIFISNKVSVNNSLWQWVGVLRRWVFCFCMGKKLLVFAKFFTSFCFFHEDIYFLLFLFNFLENLP